MTWHCLREQVSVKTPHQRDRPRFALLRRFRRCCSAWRSGCALRHLACRRGCLLRQPPPNTVATISAGVTSSQRPRCRNPQRSQGEASDASCAAAGRVTKAVTDPRRPPSLRPGGEGKHMLLHRAVPMSALRGGAVGSPRCARIARTATGSTRSRVETNSEYIDALSLVSNGPLTSIGRPMSVEHLHPTHSSARPGSRAAVIALRKKLTASLSWSGDESDSRQTSRARYRNWSRYTRNVTWFDLPTRIEFSASTST
jgi:hypothetical protein